MRSATVQIMPKHPAAASTSSSRVGGPAEPQTRTSAKSSRSARPLPGKFERVATTSDRFTVQIPRQANRGSNSDGPESPIDVVRDT